MADKGSYQVGGMLGAVEVWIVLGLDAMASELHSTDDVVSRLLSGLRS